MSKAISTVFFCGQRSPYGMAHLRPLLAGRLKIRFVVFAPDVRWKKFHDSLSGKEYYPNLKYSVQWEPLRLALQIRDKWKRLKSTGVDDTAKEIANEFGVKTLSVEDVNDRLFLESMRAEGIEIFIAAAYPQIFTAEFLAVPRKQSINFHPSNLPKFRGAYPHYWTIASGASEGGISAHILTPEIDKGDIVAQRIIPVGEMKLSNYYQRIIEETPKLVEEVESYLLSNEGAATPQDPSKATYFRQPRDIHNVIAWKTTSAIDIKNIVRTGYAYSFFRNRKIEIYEARLELKNRNLTNDVQVEAGLIIDRAEDALIVKTKDTAVAITRMRYRRRTVDACTFMKLYAPQIGERLG